MRSMQYNILQKPKARPGLKSRFKNELDIKLESDKSHQYSDLDLTKETEGVTDDSDEVIEPGFIEFSGDVVLRKSPHLLKAVDDFSTNLSYIIPESKTSSTSISVLFCILVLLSFFVFVLHILFTCYIFYWPKTVNATELDKVAFMENKFNEYFKNMTPTFPSQPLNNIKNVKFFIKRFVQDPQKPLIVLLLHEAIYDTVNSFATYIAQTTSYGVLKSNFTILDETILDQLTDDTDIISIFKKELEEKTVLVFFNLERLPTNVAVHLHSLCDIYNPIVRKAVIIFTLEIRKFKNEKHLLKKAYKEMQSLWINSDDATLPPLLTRLIENVVLEVKPEARDKVPPSGHH